MIDLSLAYSDGQGVPQDYAKAMEWFRKGAAAGDGDAMVDIALLYQNIEVDISHHATTELFFLTSGRFYFRNFRTGEKFDWLTDEPPDLS